MTTRDPLGARALLPTLLFAACLSGCGDGKAEGDGARDGAADTGHAAAPAEAALNAQQPAADTGAAPAPPIEPLSFTPERTRELGAALERLAASERLRGGLNTRLAVLDAALMNLEVPDDASRELFAERVFVRELRAQQGLQAKEKLDYFRTDRFEWWIEEDAEAATRRRGKVRLLVPYLANVKYVVEGTFRLVEGDFVPDDPTTWSGKGVLTILARHVTGRNHRVLSNFVLDWKLDEGDPASPPDPADPASWRITSIELEDFEVYEAEILPFTEHLEQAIEDPATLAQVQRSPEHARLVARAADGDVREQEAAESAGTDAAAGWSHASELFHPAVAVVDLNRDGFDDLFLGSRLGRGQLLVSQESGGFAEAAASYGLDLEGLTSAAVFADFDNDGDQDALLGRGTDPALYLENDGQRLVDRTQEKLASAPVSVMSAALVDFDRDGLLDVYLATYAGPGGVPQPPGRDPVRDRVGPPNVLLRNEGARFTVVADSALAVERDTVQAAFADFDLDGDQDVYLANDFAPDMLFRNDGGTFVDVTGRYGINVPGPSRGAAWADYDKDGDLDLFVSGVDSAAARLVAKVLGEGFESLGRLFQGNTLLERRDDEFLRVSASTGFGKHVDKGGAVWGGTFVDLDNDRWLDLVGGTGGYTAPDALEQPGDLEADYWIELARALLDPAANGPSLLDFGAREPEHSFLGHGRTKVWISDAGRRFHEIGFLTQVGQPGDVRTVVPFDFDRDGFVDLAVLAKNEPALRLFRNDVGRSLPRTKDRPRVIGLRFVGGNQNAAPSSSWSNRDGYGVRVVAHVEEETLLREHRATEGFAAQGSSTMVIGIGLQRMASKLTVYWPSGVTQEAVYVPQGSLLTVYENPEQSPNGQAFDVARYVERSESTERVLATVGVDLGIDLPEMHPYNLVLLINTTDEDVRGRFRLVEHLIEVFPSPIMSVQAISVDLNEGAPEIEAFVTTYQPPFPVLKDAPEDQRAALAGHVLNAFGKEFVPAAVVLDAEGRVLRTFRDVPTVSHLRQVIEQAPERPK